ncbi:MAG: carboxypeptidase regulatory-like domain-containing protein [Acidobacteria bacterium]|nr:carboxypeptidase regulatory-like domain-containing protein [Acidobacteriota bacterium]
MRLLGLILVLSTPGAAQTGTGRIVGLVTDPVGAVIPGAIVTATNEGTGAIYKMSTTGAGSFAIESIPAGTYRMTAEAEGFRLHVVPAIRLAVGSTKVVDVSMEVGSAVVMSTAVLTEGTETRSAMIHDVIERRALMDLPLNGRNPLALITLQPGLIQRTNNGAGTGTHVNGSRDGAFNVTIDGIDGNEPSVPNPQLNVYRLNPDNVQEFQVVTHNATADYGRNSGAQISIATRSGTNEIHGTVYEFFRNTSLNANEFFNNALKVNRPELKLNQFGAEGGGPILRNKTFFFGSWQGQRIILSQPIASSFGIPTVYTPSARAGLFRYFVADPNVPFFLDGQRILRNTPLLVDPSTGRLRPQVPICGGAVTTNCVASYNIFANDPARLGADTLIRSFLDRYQRPNTFAVGDGLNVGGFAWNPPSRTVGPHYLIRVDHFPDQRNSIFVRFLQSDQDTREGDFTNSRPKVFPDFPPLGEVFRTSKNLAIGYRHAFSPSVVNDLTIGFARFSFLFTFGESNPAFPDIEPYFFSNIDSPVLNIPRTARTLNTFQFVDNLSLISGSHHFKTGLNVRFLQHNDTRGLAGGFSLSPTIYFDASIRPPGAGFNTPPIATGSRAGINAADNTTLLNAINELLGIPARITQGYVGDLERDAFQSVGGLFALGYRYRQINSYAQDEWRIRPNLTVQYGVRWELNLAPGEAAGRVYVPDGPIEGSRGPVSFVQAGRWYQHSSWKAFAPRVAFAWQPFRDGKTVIRAGYGMAFDTLSTFRITAVAGKIPGLVIQCRNNIGTTTPAGCPAVPDLRVGQGLDYDLPAPTARPSGYLQLPAQPQGVAPSGGAFDPNLKLPTVHEWNLTVQRELPNGMMAQVSYVGKRGTRLFRGYNLNQIDASGILPDFLRAQQNLRMGCNPDGAGCPAGVVGTPPALLLALAGSGFLNSNTSRTDFLRNALGNLANRIDQTNITARGFPAGFFRPNPQFSDILYIDSGGDSYYHGLQAELRRHFATGLQFGIAYTLGKSIDNQSVDPVGSSSGGGLSVTNSRTPTDIRNWRLDRSLSDFDNRHVLVVHGVYDLPFGPNRRFGVQSTRLRHLIGGWSATGIFRFQSGEPFTINSGSLTVHNSKQSRAVLVGPRPDFNLQDRAGVTGPVFIDAGPLDNATNCVSVGSSYLCIPRPGESGMSRNAFRGPSYWNLDLGSLKQFDLSERFKLQFRAEFFNALNHTNFDNPRHATGGSPALTSSLFGRTCCLSASTPSSAFVVATGESQRVIQLALKLSF